MQRYITIRFLQSLLALFVMSMIVFSLARMTGDPLDVLLPMEAGEGERERVAKHWGLDRPLYEQYFVFLGKALRGDFGTSWKWQGHTAMGLVLERMPATLELAGARYCYQRDAGAYPIGVLTAVWRDTLFDSVGKVFAILGQSLPSFWLGIVLDVDFRRVMLGWLPTSGRGGIRHMILPAVCLGWFQVAAMMRLVRSSMLDVLDSEFVKLTRIKGLPGMEGGVEALLAERGDYASDLFCDHRGGVDYRLGDHRERLRLARHWTAGCGCGQGQGFPGGAGDRHRLCSGIHPHQSVGGYSLRLY